MQLDFYFLVIFKFKVYQITRQMELWIGNFGGKYVLFLVLEGNVQSKARRPFLILSYATNPI